MNKKFRKFNYTILIQESFVSPTLNFGVDISNDSFIYTVHPQFSVDDKTRKEVFLLNETTLVFENPDLIIGAYAHELLWVRNGIERVVFQGTIDVVDKVEKHTTAKDFTITLIDETIDVTIEFSESVINQGPQGLPGKDFKFEDFTPEQLEALKGEKGDPLTYNDLTQQQKQDLANLVPANGVVEQGNTQAINGGAIYDELIKKTNNSNSNIFFRGIISFDGNNINIKNGSYVVKGTSVQNIVNHSVNIPLQHNSNYHILYFNIIDNTVSLVQYTNVINNVNFTPIAIVNPVQRAIYTPDYSYGNNLFITGNGKISVDFENKTISVTGSNYYKIGNGRGAVTIPTGNIDFSSVTGSYATISLDTINNILSVNTTANSFGLLDLAMLDLTNKDISTYHSNIVKSGGSTSVNFVKSVKLLGAGIEIDPITKIFSLKSGNTYFQKELLYTPQNNNIDMKPVIGSANNYVSVVVGSDNMFQVVLAKESINSGKLEVFTYNPLTNEVYGVNRNLVTIKGSTDNNVKVKDKRVINIDSYPKNYYFNATDIGITDMSTTLITSDALSLIYEKSDELISQGFVKKEIGRSVEDRPLYVYSRLSNLLKSSYTTENYAINVVLFCGVHGNEQGASYTAAYGLSEIFNNVNDDLAKFLKNFCNVYYFPVVNPDGIFKNTYNNANDVNLSGDFIDSLQPENIAIKAEFDLINNVDVFIDYHNIANGDALVYYSSEDSFLPLALSHFNNLSLKWIERGEASKMYGYVSKIGVSNSPRDYMLTKTRLSTNLESPWKNPFGGTIKYDKKSLEFSCENYINFLFTFLKGL